MMALVLLLLVIVFALLLGPVTCTAGALALFDPSWCLGGFLLFLGGILVLKLHDHARERREVKPNDDRR